MSNLTRSPDLTSRFRNFDFDFRNFDFGFASMRFDVTGVACTVVTRAKSVRLYSSEVNTTRANDIQ